MSDDDAFMYDSDAGSFDFGGSDDEMGSQAGSDFGEMDTENKFYAAQNLAEDEPADALELYRDIVAAEPSSSWGQQAATALVSLTYKLGRLDECADALTQLLGFLEFVETRAACEKSLETQLDALGTSRDVAFLGRVYNTALKHLKSIRHDRLWLRTMIRQSRWLLDGKDYDKLKEQLPQLLKFLNDSSNSLDDQRRGTALVEAYSIEMQLQWANAEYTLLKETYKRVSSVRAAMPPPKVVGAIKEYAGKMHMKDKRWMDAKTAFFESFKHYEETGDMQRFQVLKYLVLASMLSNSVIDPFDSQETKPYKDHPEIQAMTQMVASYQRHDVENFRQILNKNKRSILGDDFIAGYVNAVMSGIRAMSISKIIRPYTRIQLDYLAKRVETTPEDVEKLVAGLILDSKTHGRIDQVERQLDLSGGTLSDQRFKALASWAKNVDSVFNATMAALS
ncbi:PCI-domain-containing protein [Ramicandelaber brevisporus]|nr:PCI-domain-containing protein [Ramicandelaber brevisporus]